MVITIMATLRISYHWQFSQNCYIITTNHLKIISSSDRITKNLQLTTIIRISSSLIKLCIISWITIMATTIILSLTNDYLIIRITCICIIITIIIPIITSYRLRIATLIPIRITTIILIIIIMKLMTKMMNKFLLIERDLSFFFKYILLYGNFIFIFIIIVFFSI